jgi:hypothetical protein
MNRATQTLAVIFYETDFNDIFNNTCTDFLFK